MFKKIISITTTIALSTMTSFPAHAQTKVDIDNTIVEENLIFNHKNTNLDSHIENILKAPTTKNNMQVVEIEEVSEEIPVENIEEDIVEESFLEESSIDNFISFVMESTAYTGGGITASGLEVMRDPNGLSTVAVDPSIIPLGSLLDIPGYGYAIAADTGGAIKGNIIDIYLDSYDEAINWGRRIITVNLIAYPGEW